MKSETYAKATVIAILAMLTIGVSPLALADGGGGTGEAGVGNVAPTVTSVTAPTVLGPVKVNFSCTVQDNNTLEDIATVELVVYLFTVLETDPDDIVNHYTFKYDAGTTTWSEIGPNASGSHMGICTEPSDLDAQSGEYSVGVILSGAATAGDWTAKWTATDDNVESGDNTGAFTVNEYMSLAIDLTTQTFNGNPGETGRSAAEGPITCTVTANTNFDIKTKLGDNWIGTNHGGTIGADNTHAMGEVSVNLTTIEYQNVWTDETLGEGVKKTITYTLDLPNPLRDDAYTTTFEVQAVNT